MGAPSQQAAALLVSDSIHAETREICDCFVLITVTVSVDISKDEVER